MIWPLEETSLELTTFCDHCLCCRSYVSRKLAHLNWLACNVSQYSFPLSKLFNIILTLFMRMQRKLWSMQCQGMTTWIIPHTLTRENYSTLKGQWLTNPSSRETTTRPQGGSTSGDLKSYCLSGVRGCSLLRRHLVLNGSTLIFGGESGANPHATILDVDDLNLWCHQTLTHVKKYS